VFRPLEAAHHAGQQKLLSSTVDVKSRLDIFERKQMIAHPFTLKLSFPYQCYEYF
jgi:hypothetical protein